MLFIQYKSLKLKYKYWFNLIRIKLLRKNNNILTYLKYIIH